MPKLILYSKNGKIIKEVECWKVEPYFGSVSRIYEESGDNFLTNLPFIVEDVLKSKEIHKDKNHHLKLLNEDGDIIREWNDANNIDEINGLIVFRSEDKWHSLCGSVIIEE